MNRVLLSKLREALLSVLPVLLIVTVVGLTELGGLEMSELTVFLISSVFLIVGIGLFNLGADMAMTPMGEHIGAGLTKSKNMKLLLGVCFLMGLLITVAEPDLSVLASQVSEVMSGTLLIATVGIGVGMFLLISVLKIIFKKPLASLIMYFYMAVFALTAIVVINGNSGFLALAFDSGGVTTGPVTVPFIMALGVGIAATLGGKHSTENSFGLIALCSIGPVLAVTVLGITATGEINYSVPDYSLGSQLGINLLFTFLEKIKEVAIALGLIVGFFALLQYKVLRLPRSKIRQITVGLIYTFAGLVIFLSAVSVGFMPIGFKLGQTLAAKAPAPFIVGFGFVIGLVTVLAEPAVHVLNKQVEEVTDGTVSKTAMTVALSAGVGISIALSFIRILCDFNILYYIVPGYFISLGLSFFVPGLYTAIAFDSGGVASGPLTSSFILPLAIGICCTTLGPEKVLADAFGIVAMVAMTPLITIQILGFRAILTRKLKERIAMKRILGANDEQIITFL